MVPAAEFFFLDAPDGQRFCAYHAAATAPQRGSVLFVHAFAEEMNKSRRMAALQSRAMSAAGFDVLQIDLLGCGDSSGDFRDASWQAWIEDVLLGVRWLQARRQGPLWLWGLRAGCLLAVEAARHLGSLCHFLFWQPPPSGKLLLQQFLRLRIASDMLDGKAKGLMATMKQQLAEGESIEIAGYSLPASLAQGLERATLAPVGPSGTAAFIELSTRPEMTLSPAVAGAVERWTAAGSTVLTRCVNGPAFWQTTEIEDAPALLPVTLAAMSAAQA